MPDMMTLLTTRRTVSAVALGAPAPTSAEIDQILTVASRVPDHGKLTPWRFILYPATETARIGETLAALWQKRDPAAPPARLEQERTRFSRAPLVIGVVSRAGEHVKIPIWEQQLSAGAAIMNLIWATHALGYSAQWLTEWVAYDDEAARFLGARDGERFAGFVQIGTPMEAPVDRPRPALADIVSTWGG